MYVCPGAGLQDCTKSFCRAAARSRRGQNTVPKIDVTRFMEQSGMRKARFGGYEPDDVRAALQALCTEYEQRLGRAEAQARKAEQENAALQQHCQTLTAQNNRLSGQNAALAGSSSTYSRQKESLDAQVSALQERNHSLNDQVAVLRLKNGSLQKEKEKLQERLAKLSGGVAVLYVGAASEVEMKEKKDRVDDALRATRAAIEEGIVPGGGVAYIRALDVLEGFKGDNIDETTGVDIIKRAIEEPLRQIVANAGKEGAVVVQKVREGKGDYGYNARTDIYENLHAAGVVDPAKVARVALENAASIAGMFLTTECVIVEKKEDKPEMPMGAPGLSQ